VDDSTSSVQELIELNDIYEKLGETERGALLIVARSIANQANVGSQKVSPLIPTLVPQNDE